MMKKLISIVSPCFNEEENIGELYARLSLIICNYQNYDFEIIFIDNCSTDKTRQLLRELAVQDPRVKVILNTRNFGHIRSPYWGIIQSRGDATIYLASDLQDPPEHIPQFIEEWERGWKLVMMVKPVSQTSRLMHWLRKGYYSLLDRVSDVPIVRDSTGFGLYDKVVLDKVREINDPYPFLRGLICELGYPVKTIQFEQPRRQRGISKNNFYTLYDIAMLGLISNSLLPVRLAGFFGLILSAVCLLVAFGYLIFKLLFWDSFPIGIAPLIIGVFFLFGLMFGFIGLLGEYIGSIHTYVKRRPIVVEEERVNF
jgi:glycosyltransferase involved in cell wall biosynthesis